MVASRQDAWTEDDDLVLAEVTLRHIREGGTQLAAFEEVGQRLGRTSAACGFRWNSTVRKQYDAAISIAKAQRQQMKKLGRIQPEIRLDNKISADPIEGSAPELREKQKSEAMLDSIISQQLHLHESTAQVQEIKPAVAMPIPTFTQAIETSRVMGEEQQVESAIRLLQGYKDIVRRSKQLERELEQREREIKDLKEHNLQLRKNLEDHIGVNNDYKALLQIMDRARRLAFLKEEESSKPVFKMDSNGNLERIE
ncbi:MULTISPECIES: RsfA family transcriptional regulator [Brevibacillus]|uniref:RsfA family transcriptional regulator n=1 Tax=Brevibacillus TaxID=55080 RepID=UPI000B9BC135|nr:MULTISPECIES: RsfA family transcriptional regulator [Brevibacillus]MBG9788304.1 precorrin-3B C17-methyltransferase [Brevibacillus laterosporus]MCG7316756.1 RsfA family transcriptional regulator [Brevibacillus laterosporus]MED1786066.1 RsfA family transcriptional regulator [Brevibacillus laterosporus]RFB38137.1 RsfA family transcriptional regulator [Brevibacillus sp. VP]